MVRLFARDPELAACYRSVFKTSPLPSRFRDPQRTVVNVGKSLAAFQETFVTARTSFDAFRDALAAPGAGTPIDSVYPAAAQRGLKLFVDQAGCVACHQGRNFSDGQFHNVLANERAGRPATQRVVAHEVLRGQFRTPSLRNVTATPPYMHDGRIDSLRDAVMHGSSALSAVGGRGELATSASASAPSPARSLLTSRLSPQQVDDLVAFLATLTDAYGPRRPWSSDVVAQCQ